MEEIIADDTRVEFAYRNNEKNWIAKAKEIRILLKEGLL